ncbi:hypothetical protein Efla_001797 [Eimeria flavescens]
MRKPGGRWTRGVLWSGGSLLLALLLPSLASATRGGTPRHSESGRFAAGDRLTPGSTLLVSVGPEEVSALSQALPFHFANVTFPEQHLASYREVGVPLTHELAKQHSVPLKNLRTSAVQCVERPLKVQILNDYSVACLEGGVAMLVSVANVHVKNGRYFGYLVTHHESGSTAVSGSLALPLASLNPTLWGTDQPRDLRHFRGTAVCLKRGQKLQVVEGWPVRAPKFKPGPWDVKVLVERAFLTPSNSKKEHFLHADLKVLNVPRDTAFVEGPQPVRMPFAGYVKLPSKYHGLEAAIIRERLAGKACHLRRTEPKSTVELKCDQLIDAKIASLNKLYKERPPVLRTLRNAGILMGGSLGAFTLAAFMQMLGNIDGTKPAGDPEGCLALGAVSAIIGVLALLVESPRLGYKFYKWKQKYNRKARRIAEKAVAHEAANPTTKSNFVDLVLVIPAREGHAEYVNAPADGGAGGAGERSEEYKKLARAMRLRTEEAAAALLPLSAAELASLGLPLLPSEATEEGEALPASAAGEEMLPAHLSAAGMDEALTEASRAIVEELLKGPPEATFALQLLKAQLTRKMLGEHWVKMRSKLTAASCNTAEQVDMVPLLLWVQIHRKLERSGGLLKEAQFEPELKRKLLSIQEEQQLALKSLLEARVREEADAFQQVLANINEENREDELLEAKSKIEKLKAAVRAAGLPARLLTSAIRNLEKRVSASHSDAMEIEPLEEDPEMEMQTPPVTSLPEQQEAIADMDSNVEFLEDDTDE